MLANYRNPEWVRECLYQTETRNMQHYGYGILPVLEIGASAIQIPYATIWQHEAAKEPNPKQRGYYALESLEHQGASIWNRIQKPAWILPVFRL